LTKIDLQLWGPTATVAAIAIFLPPGLVFFAFLVPESESAKHSLLGLILDPIAGPATLAVYALAMIGGLLAAFGALRRDQAERKAIKYCEERLRVQGDAGRRSLNEQENTFVQPGKRKHTPAVERLVGRLWQSARRLSFEPSNAVIATYVPEIAAGSRQVRSWQTVGVRLGILGTFIGLILALVPVAQLFTRQPDAAIGQDAAIMVVGEILSSLSVAFGTSIAGLFAALLLQLQAGILRAREDSLLRSMEDLVGKLQFEFAQAINDSPIAVEMKDLQVRLEEHRGKLHSAESSIHTNTNGLERTLLEQAGWLRAERDEIARIKEEQKQREDQLAQLFSDQIRNSVQIQRQLMEGLAIEIRNANEATLTTLRDGLNGAYRNSLDPQITRSLEQASESLMASSLNHAQIFDQRMQHYLAQVQDMPFGSSEELAKTLKGMRRALERNAQRSWLSTFAAILLGLLCVLLVAAIGFLAALPFVPAWRAQVILLLGGG